MFVFWLPNQRFLSCRLIVPDSALLVADSALFGCRLIVADSALLVADSDGFWLPTQPFLVADS